TASPTTPTVKSTISCLGTTAPPEQNRSPDAYALAGLIALSDAEAAWSAPFPQSSASESVSMMYASPNW
ncbi:hypothetical protein, partial [Novosphingobium chloroacetimidivorans]|uniref:hypothetical protein n=1 Tax=Novosphingobium chloroacetimidivorans TaxID=1428314 RepID=UPI001C87CCF1